MALPLSGQPFIFPAWARGLADGPFVFPGTGAQHRDELGSSRPDLGGGPAVLPRCLAGTWGKRRSGEN